jgi:hypothetical protein
VNGRAFMRLERQQRVFPHDTRRGETRAERRAFARRAACNEDETFAMGSFLDEKRAGAVGGALDCIERDLMRLSAHLDATVIRERLEELRAAVAANFTHDNVHDARNRLQTRLLELHVLVQRLARSAQ